PTVLDPGLQRPKMQAIDRRASDPRHQQLQMHDIIPEAALVLVLQDIPCRRLLERPRGPDAVDLCLTCSLHQSCEVSFRFFEVSRASTFANAPPSNSFVDMPDVASPVEAWRVLASHDVSPFRCLGRPLRYL